MTILSTKEQLFIDAVQQASDDLDLDIVPKIEFIDGYLPVGERVIACINPVLKVIYVSKKHLMDMGKEDIRATAIHELTHLFHESHDTDFKRTYTEIMSSTWRPFSSSGLVTIDGNKRPKERYNYGYDEWVKYRSFYKIALHRLQIGYSESAAFEGKPDGFSKWLKETWDERKKVKKLNESNISDVKVSSVVCWSCGKEYRGNRCPNCKAFKPGK